MTPFRWQQIDQLFEEALDLPAERRAEFLDKACADDPELRREVEQLLIAGERADDFLEATPVETAAKVLDETMASAMVGSTVGAYKILRELGRGGMGVVWLAERMDDQYRQQVAVKLLWPGLNNAEVVRRFRRERQILANLHHPNIAQLYDGGTTADGRPYFVMEHIAGLPITDYSDTHQLAIKERLGLFQQVCAAVQYAHQNLVIHRDLKPSNILVTQAGEVKLLDFGIARVLDPARHGLTVRPTTRALMLTPEYASPEQLRGEPTTTASDVYSLGVVLYELLTGQSPYQFKGRSLPELMQIVCEQEAVAPSVVLRRDADTVPEAAATGSVAIEQTKIYPASTTPGSNPKLIMQLRGDLDQIALTALQKDLRLRYKSVEQLAEDIRRHLAGEVISARTASWLYKTEKFIRRNKAGVALASLLLLTLLGGLIVTIWQARAAKEQALTNRRLAYAAQMHMGAQNWELANISGLAQVVNNHFPQPGEPDLRGFEWYYLWRLLHHNGERMNLQHQAEVWAVTYSPDGKTLATAYEENGNSVNLWDAATGALLKTYKGDKSTPWSVAFSPDGSKLAVAFNARKALVWDVASGQVMAVLEGHQSRVNIAAFSPDGKMLATGSDDETVKLWDAATGRELLMLRPQLGPIKSLAFSPDGKLLVTNGAGSLTLSAGIKLWDTTTWQEIALFPRSFKPTFSPNGKVLAACSEGNVIKLWEVSSQQELRAFDGHKTRIRALVFSPDGNYLASASDDRTAKLWDLGTGRELATLKGHRAEVWSVAFSPDGKSLVTGAADFTAKVWDVAAAAELSVIPTKSSDQRIAFSPDGSKLAATGATSTLIFDARTGQELARCQPHAAIVAATVFSPDGKTIATASNDRTAKLWDANTGKELMTFNGHTAQVLSVAFSPDGRRLITGAGDKTAKVWDVATGRLLLTLTGHSHPIVSSVTFSPDGSKIATGSHDKTAKLWDATTGKELATFSGQAKPIWSVAFSPDGQTLAAGSADSTVKIWQLANGRERATLTGSAGHIRSIAFSPDGSRLATGSGDGIVRVWEMAYGQEVIALRGHTGLINSVAFTRDGQTLASAGTDGNVRFWRAATRHEAAAMGGK